MNLPTLNSSLVQSCLRVMCPPFIQRAWKFIIILVLLDSLYFIIFCSTVYCIQKILRLHKNYRWKPHSIVSLQYSIKFSTAGHEKYYKSYKVHKVQHCCLCSYCLYWTVSLPCEQSHYNHMTLKFQTRPSSRLALLPILHENISRSLSSYDILSGSIIVFLLLL